VRKSDGSTVDLGVINLSCNGDNEDENDDQDEEDMVQTSSSSQEDGDQNENDNEDGDHQGGDCSCSNSVLRSESQVQLPADLDPMDIAQIILSDTSGTAWWVGALVNVPNE